jgi:signal transduction histidine kinase
VAVLLALVILLPQMPARGFTATPYALAYPAGMALLLLVAPAMPGIVAGQRRLLLRTLRERNQYLERAQRLAETRSRLRERARIAQEMHDLLGHRLTLIALYAGGLEVTTARSAPGLSEEVGIIAGTARTAMGELREVLGVLRQEPESRPGQAGPTEATVAPGAGPDGGAGFEEDVRDLVAGSRHAGLPVELTWTRSGDTDPAPVVRRAVHRVVRESLTNVHKHAPTAAEVIVVVETGQDKVHIAVRNSAASDGHHAARLPGSGSGLIGLEERVRLLGGTVRHGRDDAGGFAVEAELPATAQRAPEADEPDGVAETEKGFAGCPDALPSRWAPEPPPAGMVPGRLRGALGCTVTLLVVLAGIAGIGLWALSATREAGANGDRYAQIRTGMTRPEVERVTGAFAKGEEADDLRAREPSRPRGADCAYALGIADGSPLAYRYCFSADRLVQKKKYPVSGRAR